MAVRGERGDGGPGGRRGVSGRALLWGLGLLFANVVFWKLRIFDSGTRPEMTLGSYDTYTEHYPMARYGFEELASGRIPLWNPFQLTGMPFLGVPHVGLMYPGNWLYLLLDTAVATELNLVLHLFLAGLGAWLLARTLGLSPLAGVAWALGFTWSGWMISYTDEASLISGMSWLPMTLFAIERALRGGRVAAVGLAAAVACQLLNGAIEFFVQNMYACGAWSALRLAQLARGGDWRSALRRGAGLLAAVAAGVLVSAAQLLPSLDLAASSVRGQGSLSLEQAIGLGGALPPARYFEQALRATGIATVGVLPFAGLALGFATRWRALWAWLLAVACLAALLAFGGDLYALYFQTPLGRLFRRPHKFLHLHAFAQAGLAALAVAWLETHVAARRAGVWRSVPFGAALATLVAGSLWLAMRGEVGAGLLALLAALLGFGLLPPGRGRGAVVAAGVALQAGVLFFGVRNEFVRPAARPEIFDQHRGTVTRLARLLGDDRVHIDTDVYLLPGLMQKTGVLHRLRVVGDYQPLAMQRAADYFGLVSPPRHPGEPFIGAISLDAASRWWLMDLAAARYYVVRDRSELGAVLDTAAKRPFETQVRLVASGFPMLYRRTAALPRARFVPEARFFSDPAALLEALSVAGFDPRRVVLLEGAAPADPGGAAPVAPRPHAARASIRVDEPERVVIDVSAPTPGWLVLADAWHPDWRATRGGERVPILPAYHLFRAVFVEAGSSRVEMRYVSQAFRLGLATSGVTIAASILWLVAGRRARRPDARAIG